MLAMTQEIKTSDLLTDEEHMLKFQNGDMASYNVLVARFKDQLFNFVYRYVNDSALCEDILQETFLRLYKNKSYYKEIAKFSTWIYTIAANLAKTELRKKKRRTIFSISNYTEDNKDYELQDYASTPDQDVVSENTLSHIQAAIEKLPDAFKEVIILRDIQDLDYDEIAEITGTPLGTVKSRINRGRAKLAEMLHYLV
jgi:RNA polymerase sigma-70 factor (ECF subfamily)